MLTKMFESIVSKLWDTFQSKMVEQIADGAHNNMMTIKNFEMNFETLLRNSKSLSAKACDIEMEFVNAEIPGRKKRKREVEVWLEEVGSIQEQVAKLGNQVESEGFFMRLMDGGTVAKLNEQVDRLVEQSRNFGELVIDVSETRELTLLTNGMVGQAFDENMERILNLLETRRVPSIGVYGMGGVGKTTLAKHVHNRLQEQSTGCVCWVTVSQQFTITSLQDKIARFLDVVLLDGEDEDIRAAQIHRALSQRKNFVLVLDDVWQNIEMRKVGCVFSANGCRLILTSRSLEVCRQFRCQKVIRVDELPKDEAWKLFDETLRYGMELSPQVEDIAKDMAKLCGGLPLGITTVAGSMRGETSIHTWKNAVAELKQCVEGKNGMGEVDVVFKILKYSFDGLNRNHESQSCNEFNTLQLCFLYFSLYPEDYQIERKLLVYMFISEGLIDERRNRRAQFDQGLSILDKLVNMCLLQSTVDYEGNEFVMMHDLVRGMALKVVEGKYMTRAGYSLKETMDEQDWTEGLEKVFFVKSGIKRIGDGISPNSPNLSTLDLSGNVFEVIPNSFFSRMPSLCTLDLCDTNIKSLPDSICDMKSLKALLLNSCRKLEIVPYLGNLKALRELDLSDTAIKAVPQGVEELLNLRMLSIDASRLEMLPRGLLRKLGHLQRVIFPFHIKVPMVEIEGLKLLEEFSGTLKNANDFNWFITSFGHDTCYRIIVGSYDSANCRRVAYWNLRNDCANELILSKCNLKDEKVLEKGIVHLGIERCEGMSICFVDLFSPSNSPTSLKTVRISKCGGTECILRSEQGSSSQISKTLENISLIELEDLKEVIQKGEIGASAAPAQPVFSSLKKLSIGKCNKMRKVGSAVLQAPNLTGISICDCGEIEEIFDDEGRGCVSLPRLKQLYLSGLPRLRKLGLSALSPNLEIITIQRCGEIEEIFEDEGRGCVSAPRLEELKLKELPRLRKLGLSALSPNLESIKIEECGAIEEIFDDEVRGVFVPSLEHLELRGLPRLRKLGLSALSPNLKSIKIRSCGEIEEIFDDEGRGFVSLPSLKQLELSGLPRLRKLGLSALSPNLESITIEKCGEIEEIFDNEGRGCVSLPSLKQLKLCEQPRLRKLGLLALSPNLERITIEKCGEIEEIFEDEGRGCVSLPRLKWLDLRGLPRLRKVGLSALSPNLESITIEECGEIEEIFEDEGRGSITLPTLSVLSLRRLPKLKSVCQSTMICNSIIHIILRDCPRLTKKLPVHHVDDLPPPNLERIAVDREWWESLEWENPSLPHHINHLVEFNIRRWPPMSNFEPTLSLSLNNRLDVDTNQSGSSSSS